MDLSGKRVTVMGLGRFGGGLGVTRWLCSQGADVLVTDLTPAESLAEPLETLRPLIDSGQVALRLGEHNVSDFTTCDLVVANVAVPVPWQNRFIRAAEAARIPVTTEIALFIERLPEAGGLRRRTVGVTGSVGKSTTAAMVHHALSSVLGPRGGRVLLGGNIGGSLLEELRSLDEATWLVLELSSAMLYWLDRTLAPAGRSWSPGVAVVTNISANHIDWHGDFPHYQRSKQVILRHQREGDTAVLGSSVLDWRGLTPARIEPVDSAAFTDPIRLPGEHNRENAAAAWLACRAAAAQVPAGEIAAAIASFGGLSHRLQLVAEIPANSEGGSPVRFFNDSKSTTPESCLKAIEAVAAMPGMGPDRIHLIAGGYDKGSDLSPIAHTAARLAGIYTIGKTGPAIAAAASQAAQARVHECGTIDRAFAAAAAAARPGDAVLLSPGCASWDQFINFEQRGEAFIRLVRALEAKAPCPT